MGDTLTPKDMSEDLHYIPTLIKETEQKAVNADWAGDKEKASALWREVGRLTDKLHRGEQFDAKF